MKIFLFGFCLFLLTFGCVNQESGWEVKIEGKIRYPQVNQLVYLEQIDGQNKTIKGSKKHIDVDPDGLFKAIVHITEPGYFRFDFYGTQKINLIVDRSDMTIEVDGNSPSGFVDIQGSPDRDLLVQVSHLMQVSELPRVKALNVEFAEATQSKNQQKIDLLKKEYADIILIVENKVKKILLKQGPSLAVINLLQAGNVLNRDTHFDFYQDVAALLKKEWPTYSEAKKFVTMVEKMKMINVGSPAPEIALPDPSGKIIKLSSFRGRYVLVDFWAEWCAPCRYENPTIVRAYNKYHDKGFEVYGVSLDKSRDKWINAIKKDGLVWTNVSDLKYFNSQAAIDYSVTAIPFSVLIDPDGIILKKNLRGGTLDAVLASIFTK